MKRFLLAVAAVATATPLHAQLTKQVVASGLTRPVYVTSPKDDPRLFIVEQRGRIMVVDETGRLRPTPFLDIITAVGSGGSEQGLLGLAFHPDYANNGLFYVNYTRRSDGRTVVDEHRVTGNRNVADPTRVRRVIGAISQPFTNHNGGCLQFGPDGYLYVALGDGGSGGDPGCRAQDGGSLLGKMLRLDVDGGSRVPATNPFVGNAAVRDEIWATGLRNPWRFSFDRETGDMFIGDVGQNQIEEISYVPASSTGGENYGWNTMEGNNCFSQCPGAPACRDASLTDPVHTYTHSVGCSVTGGYVYRGCAIPSLQGAYWFGDYCSGRTWTFRVDSNGRRTQLRERTSQLGTINNLSSFGEDSQGELYVVSLNGTVWKIVSTTTTANDLGFGTPGGNGEIPAYSVCGLLISGESAEFRLDSAAPNQAAALLVGFQNNPQPFGPLGTIVPTPFSFTLAFTTDNQGDVSFRLNGGRGATTIYTQWLMLDPAATGGVASSNALEVFVR